MTIASESLVLAALQTSESAISAAELAVVRQVHVYAEGKIKQHLGYNPAQSTRTDEYYPRFSQQAGDPFAGVWDVNSSHTYARLESRFVGRETLQLEGIPLRSITTLKVDENGRFGQGDGAFPSGSEWTEGTDYFPEWDADGLCKSGILIANGTWPLEPGSVQITYSAGYSSAELAGTGGQVDASPILGAIIETVMLSFHKWNTWKRKASGSLSGGAGVLQSEKLGDYSYSLSADASALLGLLVEIPPSAAEKLEDFMHYGIMRT